MRTGKRSTSGDGNRILVKGTAKEIKMPVRIVSVTFRIPSGALAACLERVQAVGAREGVLQHGGNRQTTGILYTGRADDLSHGQHRSSLEHRASPLAITHRV